MQDQDLFRGQDLCGQLSPAPSCHQAGRMSIARVILDGECLLHCWGPELQAKVFRLESWLGQEASSEMYMNAILPPSLYEQHNLQISGMLLLAVLDSQDTWCLCKAGRIQLDHGNMSVHFIQWNMHTITKAAVLFLRWQQITSDWWVANSAYLKQKTDIGVHDASDCPHLVNHLLPRSALLPHDVGNGKSCAAGDALVAVDQDLPICSQCLLHFSYRLAQYAIAGTLLKESVTGNMGDLYGSHQ